MSSTQYDDAILDSNAIDPTDKNGNPIPVTIPIMLAPGIKVVYTTRLGKFILYEKANLDPAKIPALLKKYGNNMTFKAEAVPYFLYQKKGRSGKEKGENVLQMLREIIESV